MSNVYYGWIPILGTRLYFYYAIGELEKNRGELSEKDVGNCGITYDKNHEYYSIYTEGDVKNKKFESVVSVDKNNKKVDNIYILYSPDGKEKKIKVLAGCDIDDKGLVTLELKCPEKKDVSDESKKADEFYKIVRNIYHSHTHHEDSKDILLKPVPSKDKLDGIEQTLSRFEQKIIIAHKELRKTMQSPKKYNSAAELITQSKGEMIYALNFVNLFKDEIRRLKTKNSDKDEEYNFVFSNALQSLNVLASKIENGYNYDLNEAIYNLNKYNYKLNNTITMLTYGILFLTFPIAVDAILNVLGIEKIFNIEINTTIVLLVSYGFFFFYLLLFVLFMSSRNKFS